MPNFFNKYPYTDFHELNLDFVLESIEDMKKELDTFVSLNSIKYADPIAWDITSQYGANTIVIDITTGVAYLSTQPVMAGVSITDTSYWTPVFNLEYFNVNNINVKDFGAVGDGLTDDTVAIQNALTFAENNIKSVYFPSGVYIVSGVLTVPQNIKIFGEGSRWYDAAYGSVLKLSAAAYIAADEYCEICNLTVDGSGTNNGIMIIGGRAYIHDMSILNCVYGLYLGGTGTSGNLSRIARVTFISCNTAVRLNDDNSTNGQGISFMDLDIRQCNTGFDIYQPSNRFYNVSVQAGTAGGNSVKFNSGANDNYFYGFYFENPNYTYEIDFDQGHRNGLYGNRDKLYLDNITNNDGTNIYQVYSRQYPTAGIYEDGNHFTASVAIPSNLYGVNPNAYIKAGYNGSGNGIKLETEAAVRQIISTGDHIALNTANLEIGISGGYAKAFNFRTFTFANQTIAAGATVSQAVSYMTATDERALCNCQYPGIAVSVTKRSPSGFFINMTNCTGASITADLVVDILAFDYIGA